MAFLKKIKKKEERVTVPSGVEQSSTLRNENSLEFINYAQNRKYLIVDEFSRPDLIKQSSVLLILRWQSENCVR